MNRHGALLTVSITLLMGAVTYGQEQKQMRLAPSADTISVGESVAVSAMNIAPGASLEWVWDESLLSRDTGDTKASRILLRALKKGYARIIAKAGTQTASVRVAIVTVAGPLKPGPGNGKEPGGEMSARDRQIEGILQRYREQLQSAGLHDAYTRQNAETERRRVNLGNERARQLSAITESFFGELSGAGLSLRDLQAFKGRHMSAAGGGSVLTPGQASWDASYLGTERALMAGRTELVESAWRETLNDLFRTHPEAFGSVNEKGAFYGRIDIGSWVRNNLSGLGFPSDIDFSSVAVDPCLNRVIRSILEQRLRSHVSLDMVSADALLTAHGQATPDVFIGEWGKTFAELDMLKRSSWTLIELKHDKDGNPETDENGNPVLKTTCLRGVDLFWEHALRSGTGDPDFPHMDLDKEPMLSLEMLRHGVHDIEHGPFERGQKIVKMLKYVERSYFMNKKAVAEYQWNPYAENNPQLAAAADAIIKNKDKPAMVEEIIRSLAGEPITEQNIDSVVEKITAIAKSAMIDNAVRSLAFRMNKIALTQDADTRAEMLEKLWTDLHRELETFRQTGVTPPETMERVLHTVNLMREGKLSPAEMEAKAKELHALLDEQYKLPTSVIDRVMMWDPYLKLRAYLRDKLQWKDTQVEKFIQWSREKYPRAAYVHDRVMELNAQLEKTTSGSTLLKTADFADNAFNIYDAYISSPTSDEALWNTSLAMGRIGLQQGLPSLQVPLAFYDACREGSPKPVAMAVAFVYFPFAGQLYMVGTQLQRADVGIRDAEFYGALSQMLACTEFNTEGRITGFRLKNIIGTTIDTADVSPPGNRKAIVDIFNNPESPFFVSPNFRYWSSLVPEQNDRFGRYEDKLAKLRRFFPYSEEIAYSTLMLANFRAKPVKLSSDSFAAQREAALQAMEENIRQTIWIAMADALESCARSTTQRKNLEEKIKKLEESFDLRDADVGKGKGLLSRIQWEIRQQSSLFTGENDAVVAPIFDRYVKAYSRIEEIRTKIILGIWKGRFGVDYVAAQSDPMKLLLDGKGVPRLTGELEKDVALAESCLAAHETRAATILKDLGDALGREVDPHKDAAHLPVLGQWSFEWQQLMLDYDKSADTGLMPAANDRRKAYKAYLEALKAGPESRKLSITGPARAEAGSTITLVAMFRPATTGAAPRIVWNDTTHGVELGLGPKVVFSATTPMVYDIQCDAEPVQRGDQPLTAHHTLRIEPRSDAPAVRIVGATALKPGARMTLRAVVEPAPIGAPPRMVWSDETRRIELGSGPAAVFSADEAGVYTVVCALVPEQEGEALLSAQHEVTVTEAETRTLRIVGADHVQAGDQTILVAVVDPPLIGAPPQIVWSDETSQKTVGHGLKVSFGSDTEGTHDIVCIMSPARDGEPPASARHSITVTNRLLPKPAALAIIPPPDALAGALKPKESYLFAAAPENLPASAAYRWSYNGKVVAEGTTLTLSFPAEGTYPLELTATWATSETSPNGGLAKATCSVKVAKPPETPPEPTPPATAPETPVTGTTLKTDAPPTPVVTTQDNAAIPVTAPATEDKQAPPPVPKTGVTPPPEPPSTETKTTPPPSVNSQAPSQGVTATGAAGGDVFYGSTLTLAFSAEDTYTCPKCGAASPKKSWRESRELSYSTKAYDVTEIFIYCPKCNYRWALDAANKPQKQEPPPPPSNADYTAAREAERQAMLKQLQDPNQNKLSAYDGFTDKLGKMSGQTQPPAPQPNTSGGSKWGQAPFSEANNPVASDKPDGIRFPSTTPAPAPAPKPATTQPSGKRFVYQSSPTLTFNPPESTDGKTEVTFDRLGTVRIWAVIYTEGSPKPLETPQRTYVVKSPAFAIACSPEWARVGQEVRAQVSATPPVPAALVRYVWAQPPSSARMEYSQNSDQIGFKPADTRPVALSVEARVPHYGDVIGTATAAYEPSAYTVTAELVGRTGPKPMVWDTARGGLVPVPDGTYLVDEAIGMKATLTGGPRPDPIRWQWTVNEGTTLRGSGLGDSIAVTRSEPGGATATVTARDKDGNLLGTATADCTFSPHPPEVPLTIAVTAAGAKLKSGQQTTLHAAVKGGKAPYAITWTGAQGQGETAVLTSGKAGVQRITASVRDGAKGTASASIDVTVEAVPLNVTIAATTRTVRCGEALQLRAEARGGTPPYRFTWTGTASANNDTASFQQLRAGTAPVSVHALDSCDNSGDASITLTVNALTVKAEITGITGQPALLWDEAAHALKPAAGQHAVGQGMRVRASVVDGVLPAGAAFTWTAAGAGQLTGEARGPEAAIAFTGKGTVQATVVLASDTAGILGQAAVTATVGIGQPEIDEAKRKQAAWDEEQKKEKQAQALIEEGFALEKKGDFEGAIAKYKAALALKSDPRIQQRITTLEQKIKARDHARELISLAESCERSGNLKTALDTYQRALDIAPSEDIRQRMKRLNERLADALRAQGLVNQGYDQEKAGHMPEAIALYEEALGISPDTKLQAHCADLKTAVERNAKLQDLVNQGYAFEKAGKLQEALAAYRQALSMNPDARLQQRIDQIKVSIDAEKARLAAQTATQAIFLPEVAPVTPAPQPRVAAASPSQGSGPASPPAVVPATPARTAPSTSPSSPPTPPATVPSSPRTPAPAQVTTAQAAQPKAASTATTARSRNLTGVYQCTASADGETGTMTLTLRQEGARVTGSFKIVFSTGELKGHDFNEDFSATIDGDKFIVAGSDKAARIATDGSSITLDVPDQGTMVFKRVAP